MVRPQSERVHVLAFDLGVDFLAAAWSGSAGRCSPGGSCGGPRATSPTREAIGQLTELATGLLAGAPGRCVGAGVAVAGLVRAADGLVRFGPNLGWTEVPLAAMFAAALGSGLPVSVGNDADLGRPGRTHAGRRRGQHRHGLPDR